MKYLLLALVALLFGCAQMPAVPANPVADSFAVTVALMSPDTDPPRPMCTGVWISDEWILTAKHCTTDDEDNPVKGVAYITDPGTRTLYQSTVVYRDEKYDLALLLALTRPIHQWAPVAKVHAEVGTAVHIVGHPAGLYWTYLTGQVAGFHLNMTPLADVGPVLQIQAPIYFGNSGGGAFNDAGELVGICSFGTRLPGEGFFVSVETINAFTVASHL
jgi:S1-C subfamily serine protease